MKCSHCLKQALSVPARLLNKEIKVVCFALRRIEVDGQPTNKKKAHAAPEKHVAFPRVIPHPPANFFLKGLHP